MGEKGRAQLVRVERDRILSTMNDVNKMRITFAQVFPGVATIVYLLASLRYFTLSSRAEVILLPSSARQQQRSSGSSALQTMHTQMQCTTSTASHCAGASCIML